METIDKVHHWIDDILDDEEEEEEIVFTEHCLEDFKMASVDAKFGHVYRLVANNDIASVKVIADSARYELVMLKNKDQMTFLHFAAQKNVPEILETIIKAGANIHAKDYKGSTALYLATRQNHTDYVNLLLEHGARPHDKDNYGYNSLDYAKVGESKESLAMLEEHVDGQGLPHNGLFRGMSVEETALKRNKSLSKQGSIVTDDMKKGKMRALSRQNSSQLYQSYN